MTSIGNQRKVASFFRSFCSNSFFILRRILARHHLSGLPACPSAAPERSTRYFGNTHFLLWPRNLEGYFSLSLSRARALPIFIFSLFDEGAARAQAPTTTTFRTCTTTTTIASAEPSTVTTPLGRKTAAGVTNAASSGCK